MAVIVDDTRLQISESDGSADANSRSDEDMNALSDVDDTEFHDCIEMDTLYLSFEAQDYPKPPEIENTAEGDVAIVINESVNGEEEESKEKRAEPDALESRDSQKLDAETVTWRHGSTIREELSEASSSDIDERMQKRRSAFVARPVESFHNDAVDPMTSAPSRPCRSFVDLPCRSIKGEEEQPVPCHLGDAFKKDGSMTPTTSASTTTSTSPETTSTPDMLVTLTTTDMGISAKNDDNHPIALNRMTLNSTASAEEVWNTDSIHDSSIFDKARLMEGELDTADINMQRKSDALLPLPSLAVQERYSDELRSVRHSQFAGASGSTSSSLPHVYPVLPSYRIEHIRGVCGLERSRSAPTEMKTGALMAEDMEISTITCQAFHPLHIEYRPVSSLSAPFEEILQTAENGCKKCMTSWVQKKKMQFVSSDAESDGASMTRSEYIMDMRRGKERCDDEQSRQLRRHQKRSSRFGYINGFVIGPSVSPVPPGGIQDFSRDDAVALNAILRNDPQLAHVSMGEWTRMIGFATPADYYVHMIHELEQQQIDVLAMITARLGDQHPLVTEIIKKRRNYTKEVPSFIFGNAKGHRRTPPLAPHQKFPLFSRLSGDHIDSMESALARCGVNVASFDKLRYSFQTDLDYYEYIAQQIKSTKFDVTVSRLEEHLGVEHPFIDVFKICRTTLEQSVNKIDPPSDSARSIESMSPKSSPPPQSLLSLKEEEGTSYFEPTRGSRVGRQDSVCVTNTGCSCWGNLARGLRRNLLERIRAVRKGRPMSSSLSTPPSQ